MNKILLQVVTREQFEETIGRTFGTINTDQGTVLSRYPTWEHNGHELHCNVAFDSYEDYLEYTK